MAMQFSALLGAKAWRKTHDPRRTTGRVAIARAQFGSPWNTSIADQILVSL